MVCRIVVWAQIWHDLAPIFVPATKGRVDFFGVDWMELQILRVLSIGSTGEIYAIV